MSRQIVDNWFNAFLDRNINALESNLADVFTHFSPFGEVKGKKAYIDLVKANQEAFFDHTIEILDIAENNNSVAVRYLVDNRPAVDWLYINSGKIEKIFSYYHVGKKPSY